MALLPQDRVPILGCHSRRQAHGRNCVVRCAYGAREGYDVQSQKGYRRPIDRNYYLGGAQRKVSVERAGVAISTARAPTSKRRSSPDGPTRLRVQLTQLRSGHRHLSPAQEARQPGLRRPPRNQQQSAESQATLSERGIDGCHCAICSRPRFCSDTVLGVVGRAPRTDAGEPPQTRASRPKISRASSRKEGKYECSR